MACTRFCEQPGLRHVGGTKNPDIDAIVDLAPDLVVLDREENRREDHDELVARGLRVLVSDVRTVDDAIELVPKLADAAGVGDAVVPVELPPVAPAMLPPLTAFVPIWRRPWMTIGPATYGGSVLRHLGIELTPADGGDYPVVELGAVVAARPDLVLVPSEPYTFTDEHVDELRVTMSDADVRRIDGQDLFWWGIRTPAALSRLGEALARRPTP